MQASQARTILIQDYLEKEGYKPQKQARNGSELWYISPLRTKENTPSFKVDTVKNLWFDHGLAKGGNVVDLVIELRKTTVKQALQILDNLRLYRGDARTYYQKPQSTNHQFTPSSRQQIICEQEEEKFDILAIEELTHDRLLEYIKSRKIDLRIAREYLKQIHFKPKDKIKSYYCLGFPNNSNGFEARSSTFKGFIGLHKDITTINLQEGTNLLVFEGFIDFLSCLTYYGITDFKQSAIILNTVSLRKKALEIMQQINFKKIYFYLDNDEPGRDTQDFFNVSLEGTDQKYIDKSDLYRQYNDFNDMLCGVKDHG